ncbi:hypothetical protein Rsub_10001 [Raphidocelis subcapitata]|uniref:CBM20 domain-containing protein n=1 Tax=Raphidocelis subcapitata TaxID=307507 RepID=A0A2V0PHB2_9CHLO|nr:hypothetical protein Rsub_10001 [Raphidocelis subcapitata]|eukprot:GBF97310.1 hypothetical protein Rsub_10001 [Raphidocelis subcapitata]
MSTGGRLAGALGGRAHLPAPPRPARHAGRRIWETERIRSTIVAAGASATLAPLVATTTPTGGLPGHHQRPPQPQRPQPRVPSQQPQQREGAADAPPRQQEQRAALVEVAFSIHYRCAFGEAVHVCGSHEALGAWDPSRAVRMEWTQGDTWTAVVALPAGPALLYKYVVAGPCGAPLRWQEGGDIALCLSGPPAARLDAVDSWCQRMQLRRRYAPQPPAAGPGRRAPAQAPGVWEMCSGEDDPCAIEARRGAHGSADALSRLAGAGDAAGDAADALAAFAQRRWQEEPWQWGQPAPPARPHGGARPGLDVSRLRGAFSPLTSSQEEDSEEEEEEEAAQAAASAAASALLAPLAGQPPPPDPAAVAAAAAALAAAAESGEAMDPLVAALLADDCEVCVLQYVHDAIATASCTCAPSSASSGDWDDEAGGGADGGGAGPPGALAELRARALGAVGDALARSGALAEGGGDPAAPARLAADRRLAAAQWQLGGHALAA